MKTFILLAALLSATHTAFASNTERDSDGVPKANIHGRILVVEPATVKNGFRFPEKRSRMITVDGKEITLQVFLNTYCQEKITNATCVKGSSISRIDSSSGPKDKLPPGL